MRRPTLTKYIGYERKQSDPLQVKMEPIPSMLVSFSDAAETRVCGRECCRRAYASCSLDEKVKWKYMHSSRNTEGETARWLCGDCTAYYNNKPTTHRRGANANLMVLSRLLNFSFSGETISNRGATTFNINKSVAAVQKGIGMVASRCPCSRRLRFPQLGRAPVQAIGRFAPMIGPAPGGSTSTANGMQYRALP